MMSVRKCFDKRVVVYATALVVFLLLEGPMGVSLAQGPQNFIVTFRDGTIPAVRAASVGRAGASLRFNYTIVNAAAVTVPNDNALGRLQNDPSVLSIVPDRPVFAFQQANKKPDNPGGGNGNGGGGKDEEVVPAGVERVGEAVAGSSDGATVGVAIMDSGIDFAHSDLDPAPDDADTTALTAFSSQGGSCQDDNGHGTHVSGIVAALKNTSDVVGVAPAAKLYCVKVLDSTGNGFDSDVLAGLDWIAQNYSLVSPAIQVVNVSLGRTVQANEDPALQLAYQALYDAGIVVVTSAGNDPGLEVEDHVPAGYSDVLAVASTTAKDGSNRCRSFSGTITADTASWFTTDGAFDTSTGVGVTISAPGESHEDVGRNCRAKAVGILSTQLGGGTTRLFGTSMAAPHVSRIVARMIQNYRPLVSGTDVETIRTDLRNNAALVGTAPWPSPTGGYSPDGEKEGIAQAP